MECLLRLKEPEDCCCSHTERHLMLAWCKREILMENGLFHLPRRASELVRRTDSIILLSCNYKSKERLEPCMTELGLGERANSCIFVFWLLSYKISSWVLKEKYFWPLWLYGIFVNRAVSTALSWHHSSVLGVRKVQSPHQQSGDEHTAISLPHFHLQSHLIAAFRGPQATGSSWAGEGGWNSRLWLKEFNLLHVPLLNIKFYQSIS